MTAQWIARPWLGILLLTNKLDIAVEVSGRHILVSAPRVGFRAVYTEAPDFPELVLEMEWLPNSK